MTDVEHLDLLHNLDDVWSHPKSALQLLFRPIMFKGIQDVGHFVMLAVTRFSGVPCLSSLHLLHQLLGFFTSRELLMRQELA